MLIVGTQQSPIRIEKTKTIFVDFGPTYLEFNYSAALSGHFEKDNFVFDPPKKKDDITPWTITVDGKPWFIRKIHLHLGPEHEIEARDDKLNECHLVHSALDDPNAECEKIVIAVYFRVSTKAVVRPTIASLGRKLSDTKKGEATKCDAYHSLHPREFLPDGAGLGQWYRYEGSLTSGNHSEDVSWFVLPTEVPIRSAEFKEIKDCAHQKPREVFELNRRFVLRSFP